MPIKFQIHITHTPRRTVQRTCEGHCGTLDVQGGLGNTEVPYLGFHFLSHQFFIELFSSFHLPEILFTWHSTKHIAHRVGRGGGGGHSCVLLDSLYPWQYSISCDL